MGGTTSKSTATIINETITDIVFKTLQECTSGINQTQQILVANSKNIVITDVKMEQYASVDMLCFLDDKTQLDLENTIVTTLNQIAETKAPTFAISETKSKNVTEMINTLVTNVMKTVEQDCSTVIVSTQQIVIDESENVIVDRIRFIQSANIIFSCLMSNDTIVKNVNELSNYIDQHSKTERISIIGSIGELFSGLFEGINLMLIFFGFIIVLGLIGGLIFLLKK
jgi:hypothetical protein